MNYTVIWFTTEAFIFLLTELQPIPKVKESFTGILKSYSGIQF
jgi:hypothetical protein